MKVIIEKHEWHQVDSQYTLDLDEDLLREIYPDYDDDEIQTLMQELQDQTADLDQLISDAWDNEVELEWDQQYDDWWTHRKGGYDVTYEYGDENSYHTRLEDKPPTHKCTKCRWAGNRWETLTQHLREDGSIIEDYYENEEISHDIKDVCPMCDSDVELTEEGIKDEQERKERLAQWETMEDEETDDEK
jgi:hypothetical protein